MRRIISESHDPNTKLLLNGFAYLGKTIDGKKMWEFGAHWHEHTCQSCNQVWRCSETNPVWDQDDSDCRWWTYVQCNSCREKGKKCHNKVTVSS